MIKPYVLALLFFAPLGCLSGISVDQSAAGAGGAGGAVDAGALPDAGSCPTDRDKLDVCNLADGGAGLHHHEPCCQVDGGAPGYCWGITIDGAPLIFPLCLAAPYGG